MDIASLKSKTQQALFTYQMIGGRTNVLPVKSMANINQSCKPTIMVKNPFQRNMKASVLMSSFSSNQVKDQSS